MPKKELTIYGIPASVMKTPNIYDGIKKSKKRKKRRSK